MIFYHVSTDLDHKGHFTPRIPRYRHQVSEDDSIPRVCVCPSIEDCFSAIPDGASQLDLTSAERRGYFLIFKIDTEKLSIPNESIISSKTLYEEGQVVDAEITNEHWITVPFSVPEEDTFMIKLITWEETCEDIIPINIQKLAEEKYYGDFNKAYFEVHGDYSPNMIVIHDLLYIHEEVGINEEVTLYFESAEEKEIIVAYIENHLKIRNYSSPHYGEVTFYLSEKTNLRNLYLFHYYLAKELFVKQNRAS